MLIAVADSSSSEATLRVCVVTVFARCRYGSRRARPPCRRSRGSGSWRSIRRASRRRARTAAWCSTPTSSSTTPAPSSSSCRWAALDPQLAASTPGRSADEYQPWASFPHSVTKRYNLSDLSSSSCRWSTTRGRWWRWRAARTSARTATRPTRRYGPIDRYTADTEMEKKLSVADLSAPNSPYLVNDCLILQVALRPSDWPPPSTLLRDHDDDDISKLLQQWQRHTASLPPYRPL